ncbi:hypothetical protein GOP47_0000355, partial [Adiantum capillus-veneris]
KILNDIGQEVESTKTSMDRSSQLHLGTKSEMTVSGTRVESVSSTYDRKRK